MRDLHVHDADPLHAPADSNRSCPDLRASPGCSLRCISCRSPQARRVTSARPSCSPAGKTLNLKSCFSPRLLEIYRKLRWFAIASPKAIPDAACRDSSRDSNCWSRRPSPSNLRHCASRSLGFRFQRHRKCRHDGQRTARSSSRHHRETPRPPSLQFRYFSRVASAAFYRIFHPRSQHRWREGKGRIFLIVDVIHALGLRIVPVPVRPRIFCIASAPSTERHVQIVTRLNRDRLRLVGNRSPSLRHFQFQAIENSRSFDPL